MKPLILFALLAPAALAGAVRAASAADSKSPAVAGPAANAAIASAKATPGKTAPAKSAPAAAEGDAPSDAPEGMPGHSHEEGEGDGEPFGPNESNADYLWRRSDKAFHDGDYERAIAIHRAIVALDPTDTESFGVAAWLMWSLGKGDEADAFLQRGLQANPQSADMWDTAGQQYDLQKKLPEARDAYRNAVKFTPPGENTMMLRRRLAHAAEKAGDRTLALETWRGLVKEFPNDQVNKNNLARVEKGDVVASLVASPVEFAVALTIGNARSFVGWLGRTL